MGYWSELVKDGISEGVDDETIAGPVLATLHHPLRNPALPTLRRVPGLLVIIGLFSARAARRHRQRQQRESQQQRFGKLFHWPELSIRLDPLQARRPASIPA